MFEMSNCVVRLHADGQNFSQIYLASGLFEIGIGCGIPLVGMCDHGIT
jgi:hypothetical protein